MRWDLLVDPAVCERLCITLLHSVWLVTLLAVLAWIVDRLWGRRAVERSYAVHGMALVASVLVLPVTYAIVTPNVAAPPDQRSLTFENSLSPAAAMVTAEPVMEIPPQTGGVAEHHLPHSLAIPSDTTVAAFALPAEFEGPGIWLRLAPWIAGLYAAGVVLMLTRLTLGIWRAQRLTAAAEILREGPLVDLLRSLAAQWSVRVVPTLARAERIVTPKVIGLLRPTILLPASAISGLSPTELELILAHELAHVRRYDIWVNLLQRLAETVLFFNPALWYLCRRISLLREYCCDEAVCRGNIASGAGLHVRYAQALIRVVEVSGTARDVEMASVAASGRSPSELRRRVARLFGEPLAESVRISQGGTLVTAVLATLLLVGPIVWQSAAETPTKVSDEVNVYHVNKKVSDFPEADDFSTPESAYATVNRKFAEGTLDWAAVSCRRINESLPPGRDLKTPRPSEEDRLKIRNSQILEVRVFRGTFAQVAARREHKSPYIDLRSFELEDQRWLNAGNDTIPTIEDAAKNFNRLVKWRQGLTTAQPRPPVEVSHVLEKSLSLSPEQLELMGRVELFMMHNFRDVTGRKTIEWGDVEKHDNGNRSIRYKYYATIWDRDAMIMNQVFTFDPQGKPLATKQMEGFPKKVETKKVDTATKKGMIDLVEDFFRKNFRDITRREKTRWGEVTKNENGNPSIRCTYQTTIWDKDTKIVDQVFTFTPEGDFLSVTDAQKAP